tara:strand:- start:9623 stop:12778 length:3156 start_codon:yes stop_codon:yes gene_type:complete
MAEQTFRSPGFFEREIDLTQRTVEIEGVPAGIIGTSTQGPAFVPVTLGSFVDFERKFGTLNREQFGPYAVSEWLKNRTAVTYVRVLGAGAANSTGDIQTTLSQGTVKNAGFRIKGLVSARNGNSDKRHEGCVQFIVASHDINEYEPAGYPLFTDSDSVDASTSVRLVRAMLLTATGSRIQLLDHDQSYSVANTDDDLAKIADYTGTGEDGTFKLVLSSAIGSTFGNDESKTGIRIYTASLNPTSKHYIGKFLNKNPDRFQEEQHLFYADFAVENELARVTYNATKGTVCVASGSNGTSVSSGDTSQTFRDAFGRFDTRYRSAKTTSFISQPFGNKEYDLFHFESLDDGEVGNKRVKISITNLKKSTNKKKNFGTFTVLVRSYDDTDTDLKILEQFPLCTLDPKDENYIANKVGDMKVYYNFDAETESERRINVEGKRPNRSQYVRIAMNKNVEDSLIPEETLPFGFRGIPLLKTNDNLTDNNTNLPGGAPASEGAARLATEQGTAFVDGAHLTGSILPPIPFRFKVTRGAVAKDASPNFTGEPGALELSDNRFFWGVKMETLPLTGTIGDAILQSNASSNINPLIQSYGKFLGLEKLDTLVTGSGADIFNNNKFSLSKVSLYSQIATTSTIEASIAAAVTGSANEHMREAAYLRNGKIETKNYTILDDGGSALQRITFATLAAARNAKYFNRFTDYAKFTNILHGGFDGLNILDKDNRLMNDRASSVDAQGKANVSNGTFTHQNLHAISAAGSGKDNNIVNSYRSAARIITDPMASRVNIVAMPGIKEPFVTDFVSDLTRDYSKAIYLMDIPAYDDNGNIIFSKTTRPSVQETIDVFEARGVDNSYAATYFPDMIFADDINNTAISLPSSIAALKALGYNDSVAYPWFAPAGFNRGALSNVLNSEVRLNAGDRNVLYEARINPIANFPNGGFVIFGQKTLQQDRSALDRVNVRRMLLEVKRIISNIANKLIFEQNTPQTRSRFVAEATPQLATIQIQQGVDQFKIVMDSSNNSSEDIEQNRLNGRIVLVPTRAVEFIAIDFIITNSGVSFE